MHAIPPRVPGRTVDQSGQYKCPLCYVQSTGDEVDTGWVRCPMMSDQFICLGSCIDHQGVARSDEFSTHPDRQLFEVLSRRTTNSVRDLRVRCMHHQLEIIDEQLALGEEDASALKTLKMHVIEQLALM